VDGLFADLHSLGKSFVTACASHNVSQRVAQEQARHSDPRMTAGAYIDARLLPIVDELIKISAIPDAVSRKVAEQVAPAQRTAGGTGPETAEP
jgi:hypothetical protein